jgi:hypothetical protein
MDFENDVFLEVRVISGLGGWHSFAITEMVLWVCLALSLLLADTVLGATGANGSPEPSYRLRVTGT